MTFFNSNLIVTSKRRDTFSGFLYSASSTLYKFFKNDSIGSTRDVHGGAAAPLLPWRWRRGSGRFFSKTFAVRQRRGSDFYNNVAARQRCGSNFYNTVAAAARRRQLF